jgi:phage terminase small subunit
MPVLNNPRHELYCRGVVEGKSSDQAYEDAGFKPGRNNAARLRANESIQARIKELQNRSLKRHDVTVDRIIEEYAKIAFSDIRKIYDEHGKLKQPCELPDDIAGALASFEVNTVQKDQVSVEHVAKVKLLDKRSALADLGKHFNMFTEDVTIKAEVVQNTVSDLELARRLAFLIAKAAHQL